MSKLALRETLMFLIVGGVNFLGYLFLASVLHTFGVSATMSSAAAYSLCLPSGYFGQRCTFRSARSHSVASIRYLAAQFFGLTVATATTFIAASVLDSPALLAFFLAGAAAACASYLAQKWWVF